MDMATDTQQLLDEREMIIKRIQLNMKESARLVEASKQIVLQSAKLQEKATHLLKDTPHTFSDKQS